MAKIWKRRPPGTPRRFRRPTLTGVRGVVWTNHSKLGKFGVMSFVLLIVTLVAISLWGGSAPVTVAKPLSCDSGFVLNEAKDRCIDDPNKAKPASAPLEEVGPGSCAPGDQFLADLRKEKPAGEDYQAPYSSTELQTLADREIAWVQDNASNPCVIAEAQRKHVAPDQLAQYMKDRLVLKALDKPETVTNYYFRKNADGTVSILPWKKQTFPAGELVWVDKVTGKIVNKYVCLNDTDEVASKPKTPKTPVVLAKHDRPQPPAPPTTPPGKTCQDTNTCTTPCLGTSCTHTPDCSDTPNKPECGHQETCADHPTTPECTHNDCEANPNQPKCQHEDCTTNPQGPNCQPKDVQRCDTTTKTVVTVTEEQAADTNRYKPVGDAACKPETHKVSRCDTVSKTVVEITEEQAQDTGRYKPVNDVACKPDEECNPEDHPKPEAPIGYEYVAGPNCTWVLRKLPQSEDCQQNAGPNCPDNPSHQDPEPPSGPTDGAPTTPPDNTTPHPSDQDPGTPAPGHTDSGTNTGSNPDQPSDHSGSSSGSTTEPDGSTTTTPPAPSTDPVDHGQGDDNNTGMPVKPESVTAKTMMAPATSSTATTTSTPKAKVTTTSKATTSKKTADSKSTTSKKETVKKDTKQSPEKQTKDSSKKSSTSKTDNAASTTSTSQTTSTASSSTTHHDTNTASLAHAPHVTTTSAASGG